MGYFRPEDTPRQVLDRVRALAPGGWDRVWAEDGPLAVSKLRLVGVYDDRQDGSFMLRVRLPGGRLRWQQAEAIGRLAAEFARKPSPDLEGPDSFLELTTRQDVQLHWIRFEALPVIWQRLAAVGLGSLQACGDTARNVTGCAVAGVDRDEVFDASPVVERVDAWLLANPAISSFLPRKFKIAITGCSTDCVLARINDLAFTPARREGRLGFHVWAGGGLSDYPRLASNLDLFVLPEQVPEVVSACLRLFADLGDPVHKAVNRFRAVVAELGAARIREELCRRLPFALPPGGEDLSTWQACDHAGIHPQHAPGRLERLYAGLTVPVGRMAGSELVEAARLAREYGDGGLRLTQRQSLILTGIRPARLPQLLAEPLLARLRPEPDPFERAVVACTSAPFCKFGIFNVKEHGDRLAWYLRAAVSPAAAARLQGLRLHLSGCKAACAQIHVGHIGLRATLGKDEDRYYEAFDVAAGGAPGSGRLARWVAHEVPVATAFSGIAGLLKAYTTEAPAGETLDTYLAHLPDARLAAFFRPAPEPTGTGVSAASGGPAHRADAAETNRSAGGIE